MRNLEFPLDWESVFAAIGEDGFLKPIDGGGWRDVHEVRGREEFFRAYDQSRDLCMVYQKAVEFTEYFRCFVVGQKKVRIMQYDPRRPHAERYVQTPRARRLPCAKTAFKRMEDDALKLCRALGYDLNSVEFAVEHGVPYAIDFMNPVPDADVHSVGEANFEWIVEQWRNWRLRGQGGAEAGAEGRRIWARDRQNGFRASARQRGDNYARRASRDQKIAAGGSTFDQCLSILFRGGGHRLAHALFRIGGPIGAAELEEDGRVGNREIGLDDEDAKDLRNLVEFGDDLLVQHGDFVRA